jgi:hypothetical protein
LFLIGSLIFGTSVTFLLLLISWNRLLGSGFQFGAINRKDGCGEFFFVFGMPLNVPFAVFL